MPHSTPSAASSLDAGVAQVMLTDLLRDVSRSFYLTLRVLPKGMREPIGIAYLLARAADTIADTAVVAPEQRLELLLLFREQLQGSISLSAVERIQAAVVAHQRDSGEHRLIASLHQAFALIDSLPEQDQQRVRSIVITLTRGMEFDLRTFPSEQDGEIKAVLDGQVLDNYIYLVAGCVGEFWTEITMAHDLALSHWSAKSQNQRGIRFGKALQLTNVLRDVAEDLRIGRCYLPLRDLDKSGLSPQQLLDETKGDEARPVLFKWLEVALGHYQAAGEYIVAIPRRRVLLRLATLWPVLIGLATLSRVANNRQWLSPEHRSKVSRAWIYRMIVLSIPASFSNRLIQWWMGRLAHQVKVAVTR